MTRRSFVKMVLAALGGALASACARAVPTAAPSPTPRSVVQPTATRMATATTVPTGTPTPVPTATATPVPSPFVTVRGDQFYFRGARFPINGFNYYPRMHPWRTFNIDEWEPQVTEKELRLGVGLGANTVRIFIDYNFSLDNTKAQRPRDSYFAPIGQYIQNVREFLEIAGRLNFQVIVTLLDSLDWAMYQPQNHWIIEEYLKELIPPFANDPRILCWDLQNEPDRAIVLVGNHNVIPFFQRISALVRKLDPNHLQTIGWIDRARGRYFPDLDDALDFWCFHFYDSADKLADLVRFYKDRTTKPVLLEEFGLPTGGPGPQSQNSELNQVTHYMTVLSTLDDYEMCGSVFWTLLDFPVGLAGNPPSPNDSPENHFGVFRLDYTEKPVTRVLREFWSGRRPTYESVR